MGAAIDLGWWRLLLGERVRTAVQALQAVRDDADRIAAQRCRILPPLSKHGLDVVDRWPRDCRLDVMPRRGRTILLCQREGLWVPFMVDVIATGVAEVDAADKRDVPGRVITVPDDQHLLMVGPAHAHAHVEQRLGSSLLQVLPESPILPRREPKRLGMRTPHQAPYVDSTFVSSSEHFGHFAAWLPSQAFVGVTLPVREIDQVAIAGRFDPLEQLVEIRRAVDQRAYEVAGGPRLITGMPRVNARAGVAPLRGGEEPRQGVISRHTATVPDLGRQPSSLDPGMMTRREIVI